MQKRRTKKKDIAAEEINSSSSNNNGKRIPSQILATLAFERDTGDQQKLNTSLVYPASPRPNRDTQIQNET